MSNRIITAFEPMFVFGLVIAMAMYSVRGVSAVITQSVEPLTTQLSDPQPAISVAMAKDESLPTRNR